MNQNRSRFLIAAGSTIFASCNSGSMISATRSMSQGSNIACKPPDCGTGGGGGYKYNYSEALSAGGTANISYNTNTAISHSATSGSSSLSNGTLGFVQSPNTLNTTLLIPSVSSTAVSSSLALPNDVSPGGSYVVNAGGYPISIVTSESTSTVTGTFTDRNGNKWTLTSTTSDGENFTFTAAITNGASFSSTVNVGSVVAHKHQPIFVADAELRHSDLPKFDFEVAQRVCCLCLTHQLNDIAALGGFLTVAGVVSSAFDGPIGLAVAATGATVAFAAQAGIAYAGHHGC